MYKVYDKWPQIAKESFESEQKCEDFENVNHIVFAGMGGSGAIGDIFSGIFSKTNIHVDVVKGYRLPSTVDCDTLVITISVSGNTDETLFVLDAAKKINCRILSFSSGGKMESYSKQNAITHYKIHEFHSPRASFSAFLYSMIKILEPLLPLNKNDVRESIFKLEQMQKIIASNNINDKNPALVLAEWLPDISVICYPFGLKSTAIRFKNSLQENAKMHAMIEDIIESCHNGIVCWSKSSIIKPILIRGIDDSLKTKQRYEIIKEFFSENEIDFKEIFSTEGNILSKLICLIYLLDYSSIYKAVILGIDPSPVSPIEYIKTKLNKI